MSRIGKQLIEIPAGVEFKLDSGKHETVVHVKGPLGSLSRAFSNDITIKHEGNTVTLSPTGDSIYLRALWGTYGSHIANMVLGVTKGFVKKMIIEGIGYKADVKGSTLNLSLGLSHPVNLPIPEGLKITHEKGLLTLTSHNKEMLGQFCADLQHWKKPEPYKGKGIRYEGEIIRRKTGKKSVA